MPLFLRSLPLSLGALWHYVFLLPFVIIVCIPFMLLTFLPFVGFLVSSAIGTFITFAGYRCALAAYGRGNEPSFTKLVKSSLSLGFLNTLAGLVMLLISLGIGYGLLQIGVDATVDVPGFEDIPFAPGLTVAAFLILNSLYYCAMGVPMTAVAAAASSGARDPGPFFGFGAGLFSILAAWAVWLGGLLFLGFLWVVVDSASIGLQIAMSEILGDVPEEIEPINWVFLAMAVLYLLWGTCWVAATAVLAWDRVLQRETARRNVTIDLPKVSADDLRALREARMPSGRGEQ